jgi:glycosyltransferase involved in cell wall biosynthesis
MAPARPDRPLLSVVTVAFNAAATIERTIASVLAQTFEDIEYVVVDGGSRDGTVEILRRYSPRLRFISEPDGGIYDAMNKGVRLARGRWIHLLNADDEYASPDALAAVVPKLDAAALNYCDIEIVTAPGRSHIQRFAFNRAKLAYAAFMPHPGLIVSREQYDRIGLYDTSWRIAADHDLILRLLKAYPPHRIALVLTRMHQGGASAKAMSLGAREFRDVSIAHGQPAWLAWLLYGVKRLHWRI